MRDRRRRPVARSAPARYYVSIPRREGRAQLLATISTHMVFVGTERGLDAYAMRDFEPTPSGGKIG